MATSPQLCEKQCRLLMFLNEVMENRAGVAGDKWHGPCPGAVPSPAQISGRGRMALGESFHIPERSYCQKLIANSLSLICLTYFLKSSQGPLIFLMPSCAIWDSWSSRCSLTAQFHEIVLLAQGDGEERRGPETFDSAQTFTLSLELSATESAETNQLFSIKFHGFWVRNWLTDLSTVTSHCWGSIYLCYRAFCV